MMQAVIYCFSGTGNTWTVCKQYQRHFENNGVHCVLYPIGNESNVPDPADFDFVGFAYPIHAFNAPYVLYKFVRALPRQNGKDFFIVKTSGEPLQFNNASSIHLCDKLKKRGFGKLTNEYHYVMPYNMIFRHTDLQAQKMLKTASALIPLDVCDVLQKKSVVPKRPPFGRLIAWILRVEHGAMKVNGRCFKVTDKCVKCMKCVKNCPVGNISYDAKSGFHFGKNCVMCARCSFNCPKDAIKIGILNGWRVNGPYNFDNPDNTQVCKKPNYCKKAYEKYFANAETRLRNCKQSQTLSADEAAATVAESSAD